MNEGRPMTLLESLEPCPFCGAKGEDLMYLATNSRIEPGPPRHLRMAVVCADCGASGPESHIADGDAIREWNRRAKR
jgi:Lar family restriction alleviation protein